MKLWELMEQEAAKLRAELHLEPLEERTWHCEPLMVVNDDDVEVFFGSTAVEVLPNPDGTADLTAEGSKDGWHPGLINATVRGFSSESGYWGFARNGLFCRGLDADGAGYTWYINGAADDYGARMEQAAELGNPPPVV